MFFMRDAVREAHRLVTGTALFDATTEYLSMNTILGALLLGTVLTATWRWAASDSGRYLLLLFWAVFGFFASIRPGATPKDLDPASWIWVDVTMFPAVILTGAMLAQASGRWRTWGPAVACVALVAAAARFVG
jgi:hypothetical protein